MIQTSNRLCVFANKMQTGFNLELTTTVNLLGKSYRFFFFEPSSNLNAVRSALKMLIFSQFLNIDFCRSRQKQAALQHQLIKISAIRRSRLQRHISALFKWYEKHSIRRNWRCTYDPLTQVQMSKMSFQMASSCKTKGLKNDC